MGYRQLLYGLENTVELLFFQLEHQFVAILLINLRFIGLEFGIKMLFLIQEGIVLVGNNIKISMKVQELRRIILILKIGI